MQKEFGLCCERGAVSHATTRPDMMNEDISSCDMSELPHSVSQQLQQRSLNLRTRYSHPAVAHPVCVRHSALSDSPFPSPSATQHRPLRASKDTTRARSPLCSGLAISLAHMSVSGSSAPWKRMKIPCTSLCFPSAFSELPRLTTAWSRSLLFYSALRIRDHARLRQPRPHRPRDLCLHVLQSRHATFPRHATCETTGCTSSEGYFFRPTG